MTQRLTPIQVSGLTGVIGVAGGERYTIAIASSPTPPEAPLNLQLSKTGPTSALYGSRMTYTLGLVNSGDTAATNVTIIDTLPSDLEFVSATGDSIYDSVTKNVTLNIGYMPAHSEGSWTVTVEIPTSVPAGTAIENIASVSTTDIESYYSDNSASAKTTVAEPKPANLQLSKTGPMTSAGNGTLMTYTLNIRNSGELTASNITLVDTLPVNVDFVSASNDSVFDPVTRNVIWSIDSVPGFFGSASRTVTVKVPASVANGSVIQNNAMVSTTDLESDYSDNRASWTTTVAYRLPVNLQLSKTGRVNTFNRAQVIYTLNYSNSGGLIASNVTLVDMLPPNFEFVSASDNGTYDPVTRNVTWKIGVVTRGIFSYGSRTVTVQIPASVPVGTVIENTAVINTTSPESNYSDNSASATFTVTDVSPANLQLSKTGPASADKEHK